MINHHCPNYDDLKGLAEELHRPVTTLFALSNQNDPFYITPGRKDDAEWFAKLWRRFCQSGMHNRRVHYVMISQEQPVLMPNGEPYENTLECFMFLNAASRDARYLGLVSMRDMVDRRNEEAVINLAEDDETEASIDAEGGLHEHVPPGFDVPRLGISPPVIPQRFHVEIWCEKSTMNDVLLPLGERYGVNVVTGLGELSLTRCVELVDRAVASGKPVRVLYISDFDPGGASMPVAVARKVEFVVRNEEHDLDIQVRPVVLSHEQCIEYRLPRTPIKETEQRAAAFEARYGAGATELDALEALHPGELERVLAGEIERYYDNGLDGRIDDVVSDVQADLDDINAEVQRRHAKALKTLEVERKKVLAAITAFEKKAKPVLRKIERDLEAEGPDVDSFEWPEPDEDDEDPDPLFDSTRDYVEQIDRYKEHQGKTTERRTTEMECAQCGETFIAPRKDTIYCSKKCKEMAAYYRRSGGKVKGTEKVCLECGTTFNALRRDAVYCSRKCKNKQRYK